MKRVVLALIVSAGALWLSAPLQAQKKSRDAKLEREMLLPAREIASMVIRRKTRITLKDRSVIEANVIGGDDSLLRIRPKGGGPQQVLQITRIEAISFRLGRSRLLYGGLLAVGFVMMAYISQSESGEQLGVVPVAAAAGLSGVLHLTRPTVIIRVMP